MKKTAIFFLAVLLALSVCACASSGSGSVYTVTKNGTDYTVDQENSTIFDGTNTYQYTFSGNSSGYSIKITYPDGSTYNWNYQTSGSFTGFGSGGWSEDYDPDRYVRGDLLCDILAAGAPSASKESIPGITLLAVLALGIGLFNILSPQTAWYLSEGWKFRGAEPSDAALGLTRAGGVFAIIIGIILFLAGLPG